MNWLLTRTRASYASSTLVCAIFAFCLLWSYVYLGLGAYAVWARPGNTAGLIDGTGRPIGADFLPYWAAAHTAATAAPETVYDLERLYAAEKSAIASDVHPMLWNYPPTFLLFLMPLAQLSYPAALALWIFGTFAVFLWVVFRSAPHQVTPWLTLAFPGVVNNFLYAQNGFLSGAIFGGGFLLLGSSPFAGGFILGLLVYKPQLVVLVPLGLVAGRCWRACAGFALSATLLGIGSAAVFGFGTWEAFFRHLPISAELLHSGNHLWNRMPTVFAMLRSFGVTEWLAHLLQTGSALAAAACVASVWYVGSRMVWRASALVLATFLVVPYAFEYDQAVVALPLAWLAREAYLGKNADLGLFLVLCWIGLYFASFGAAGVQIQVGPFFTALLLALTVSHAFRSSTASVTDSPLRGAAPEINRRTSRAPMGLPDRSITGRA